MENNEQNSAQTTADEVKITMADGTIETADDSNDATFTDSAEDSNGNDAGDKGSNNGADADKSSNKSNTSEKAQKTNADYARERRKAEQEKALKKERYKAIIEVLDGENPYTHEKLEDDADVEEYLTMKEIEKSGKDPVADYSKYLKTKAKEQARQEESERSQKEWIANDKQDFVSKHPDVNLDDLIADDLFATFAAGKVGKLSMDKIYTDYQSFLTKSEERVRDRAAQVLANNAASPGKLSNQSQPPPKRIADMSKSEFEALSERVKKGEKIYL